MAHMLLFPFVGKIIALLTAVGIGLAQGALFFGDTGPDESMATRLLVAVPLAIIGGVIFGYNFKRLWFFAGVNAWVPAVFIGLSLGELKSGTVEPTELAILVTPLAVSIVAGWLGSKLKAVKNFVMLVAIIAIGIGIIVASRGYLDVSSI